MAQFKKGDAVTQIVKPVQGIVDGFQVDQETGDLLVRVTWTSDDNGDGKLDESEVHSCYFREDQLTAGK